MTLHHLNGSILTGILHTFTPFAEPTGHANVYVLKSVQVLKTHEDWNDIETGGTVLVHADQVVTLVCSSVRLDHDHPPQAMMAAAAGNGGGVGGVAGFRTDGDISKSNAFSSMELEKASGEWTNETPTSTSSTNALLEDGNGGNGADHKRKGLFGTHHHTTNNNNNTTPNTELRGGIGQWDQFQANQDQFGVKASYDENLYTTELAKDTMTVAQRREAERLAKEIEGQSTSNMHLAEERNQKIQGDFDEEDLYSGVLVVEEKEGESGSGGGGNKEKKSERTKLVLKPRSADKEEATRKDASSPARKEAKKKDTPKKEKKDDSTTRAQKGGSKKMESVAAAASSTTTRKTAQEVLASSAPPPKMNYAAVAAKANKSKLVPAVPVLSAETKSDTPQSTDADTKEGTTTTTPPTSAESKDTAKMESTKANDSVTNETASDKKDKPKSKLNAKAKSFTFNPSAKSFTPSFSTSPAPAPQQPAEPPALHGAAMGGSMPPGAPQPQPAAYMPYVQPVVIGTTPMMYQPYPGGPVRGYPAGAPPYMVPPQQQPQAVTNEGTPVPGEEVEQGGDGGVEGGPAVTEEAPVEGEEQVVPDAGSTSASGSGATTPSTQGQAQQTQGQTQQPQQMYGVNQYYPAHQTMNPTAMGRGMPNQGNVYPGMAMMGRGYHPQMLGGPQQPVRPHCGMVFVFCNEEVLLTKYCFCFFTDDASRWHAAIQSNEGPRWISCFSVHSRRVSGSWRTRYAWRRNGWKRYGRRLWWRWVWRI